MAGEIKVTYADMEREAGQLKALSGQVTQDLIRLKGQIGNLLASGFVTDAAAPAFQARYDRFNTNATNVMDDLQWLGETLDKVRQTLADADTSLANQIGS
jgi:WXG100 family type VII secretion target